MRAVASNAIGSSGMTGKKYCYTVTFFESVVFEGFCKFVDFSVELVVCVGFDFTHFAFPDVGEFVFRGTFHVAIQGVVGNV